MSSQDCVVVDVFTYACVYIAVACVYNLNMHAVYTIRIHAAEVLHFSAFHLCSMCSGISSIVEDVNRDGYRDQIVSLHPCVVP